MSNFRKIFAGLTALTMVASMAAMTASAAATSQVATSAPGEFEAITGEGSVTIASAIQGANVIDVTLTASGDLDFVLDPHGLLALGAEIEKQEAIILADGAGKADAVEELARLNKLKPDEIANEFGGDITFENSVTIKNESFFDIDVSADVILKGAAVADSAAAAKAADEAVIFITMKGGDEDIVFTESATAAEAVTDESGETIVNEGDDLADTYEVAAGLAGAEYDLKGVAAGTPEWVRATDDDGGVLELDFEGACATGYDWEDYVPGVEETAETGFVDFADADEMLAALEAMIKGGADVLDDAGQAVDPTDVLELVESVGDGDNLYTNIAAVIAAFAAEEDIFNMSDVQLTDFADIFKLTSGVLANVTDYGVIGIIHEAQTGDAKVISLSVKYTFDVAEEPEPTYTQTTFKTTVDVNTGSAANSSTRSILIALPEINEQGDAPDAIVGSDLPVAFSNPTVVVTAGGSTVTDGVAALVTDGKVNVQVGMGNAINAGAAAWTTIVVTSNGYTITVVNTAGVPEVQSVTFAK